MVFVYFLQIDLKQKNDRFKKNVFDGKFGTWRKEFGHLPVLVIILLVAAEPPFFDDDDVDVEALELPVLTDPLPCWLTAVRLPF